MLHCSSKISKVAAKETNLQSFRISDDIPGLNLCLVNSQVIVDEKTMDTVQAYLPVAARDAVSQMHGQ